MIESMFSSSFSYLTVVIGCEVRLLLLHCLSSFKFDNILVICGWIGDWFSCFVGLFWWPLVYSVESIWIALVVNSPCSFFFNFNNNWRLVSVSTVVGLLQRFEQNQMKIIEWRIYPMVEVKLSRRILTTNGELEICSGFNLKWINLADDSSSFSYSFISVWLEFNSFDNSEIWSLDVDFLLRFAGRDISSRKSELKFPRKSHRSSMIHLHYLTCSSSSFPLIAVFLNLTRSVDEEFSFNDSVDKRLERTILIFIVWQTNKFLRCMRKNKIIIFF